jgi:hypothetical protein
MLIVRDDLHPLLQTLPLSEHDKEVIFADFVKSLHLFEPFLHSDELSRLGVHEFAHSFAAECVVVLYLLVNDLGVGDDLHVIMVVLILPDHVDEFIRS